MFFQDFYFHSGLSVVIEGRLRVSLLRHKISCVIGLFMEEVDLTRPCDACGKRVGGGEHYCTKCHIHLCFLCSLELIFKFRKVPIECPMCGNKLE